MITCCNWRKYSAERSNAIRYHRQFKAWECAVHSKAFQLICSSNVRISVPERKRWKKTEIYSLTYVQEHAYMVNTVLLRLAVDILFAEHVWPEIPWFASRPRSFRGKQAAALLSEGTLKVNLDKFKGGMILTPQFVAFINSFIDYSFLERKQSINLFGMAKGSAFVVRLNHHLTVDFISDSQVLLAKIADWLKEFGLVQRTDIPSVYCRADQRDWGG